MYLGKSAIRSNTSQMNLTKEDGNLVMLDLQPDCVYMTRVDDTPLLPIGQAYIIGCVALGSLSLGMAAHIKILKALWTRSVVKTSNSIDFLFLAHHLVSIILHPPMFVYFILKNFYYPMSDLIGTAGCATILIGFDIFARSFIMFLPASIAFVRYMLVVNPQWFVLRSPIKLVKVLVVSTLLGSSWMTTAMHFSVGAGGNKPFNYCMGRFESYFNPLHEDTITPGYRPFPRQCDFTILTQLFKRLLQPQEIKYLPMDLFVTGGCCLAQFSFWIIAMGVPEFIFYPLTFYNIHQLNNTAERNSILNSDVIRWRRNTNKINIIASVYVWILQFVCNAFLTVFVQLVYGKNKFLHSLFAVISASLNFTLLPICFIAATELEVKIAIAKCNFFKGIKMFAKK